VFEAPDGAPDGARKYAVSRAREGAYGVDAAFMLLERVG